MKIEKAKIRNVVQNNEIKSTNSHGISTYTESYKGEYYNINIKNLIPFQGQSRRHFDQKSLNEMAMTIKTHGIRQPLTIIASEVSEGKYEVVSGERRWRAAEIVGLSRVPCILIYDKNSAEEIALIENVQRKNLHPIELMRGFKNLLDKKICSTHQEIADKIGVSRTVVVEILNLQRLPNSTQELLLNKEVKSRDILRQLLKSQDTDHENIILGELNKKNNKKILNKCKILSSNTTKSKILSVYLKNERVVFDMPNKTALSGKQKTELKTCFHNILSKI